MMKWITRLDDKGRQLDPDEKVSREEALCMYTIWAARYSGEEDILGSIELGRLADLVVLGGEFLTFPENDLDREHHKGQQRKYTPGDGSCHTPDNGPDEGGKGDTAMVRKLLQR